jgi:hypothetical protein
MPLAMYWNTDDEQKRKQRLEESLRLKKEARRGECLKEKENLTNDETNTTNNVSKQDIDKQTELINNQQSEIRDLKHLMVQQNKVLEKILENQSKKYEVVYQSAPVPEAPSRMPDFVMPTLGEIDIKVINTDGIESEGEVGDTRTRGDSVKERVARLKKLKQGV